MRKGFEGLYGLVRDKLCYDPLSGHLFFHQPEPQPNQSRFLGWKWSVGMRQTA